MALRPEDIRVGVTYRGKRRRKVRDEYDGRTVLNVSGGQSSVQYDSETIGVGRHYPTVSMERFLAWALEPVSE